ncbi:hypothetical protein JB92DRAFT_3148412 [Gautieria morchelliformis]|nr:hypothetical protein JB92DRAFT_3148412 [Gautieria morchelliformis]
MTSQNQANVKNSADAPNPYGAASGIEHTPTHHGGGAAAGHADNFKGEPFPGAASGATGGCYGEQTAQPDTQQMQASNFQGVPCTATWDTQRAQPDSGPQREPPESKGMSGGGAVYEGTGMGSGAQTGKEGAEQAGTTAAGEEGRGGAVYEGTGMTAASTSMKGVVSGVHGAGDAVRGKVMQGVDEVFGDEAGAEKYRDIAEAGMQEMRMGFGGRGGAKGHGDDVGGGTGTGGGGEGGNAKGDTAQGGTGLREVRS